MNFQKFCCYHTIKNMSQNIYKEIEFEIRCVSPLFKKIDEKIIEKVKEKVSKGVG